MKDSASLEQELLQISQTLKAEDQYTHYKHPDRKYKIISIAFLESNEEPCVVYQALYSPYVTWIRPVSNFLEEVIIEGKKIKRFIKTN
ncbi:MAG: DUF1653 domain-containing protein [Candidatus Abawacabacteria bacterium]|nr:DUF1653 domain-containing protein [Candidatus Abawacabacteria bacterium]